MINMGTLGIIEEDVLEEWVVEVLGGACCWFLDPVCIQPIVIVVSGSDQVGEMEEVSRITISLRPP